MAPSMKVIKQAKGLALHPPYPPSLLSLVFFILVHAPLLSAADHREKGKPTPPGERCQTEPLPQWTEQEQWVWKQLCEEQIADFHAGEKYGGQLDPKTSEGWLENRVLRAAFLEAILLHEPYQGALSQRGVRIQGARFTEPLDLSYLTLAHPVRLEQSRFEKAISLRHLRTAYLLSFQGSKFLSKLDMASVQVGDDLVMDTEAEFEEVILRAAKIQGNVTMAGAKFTGPLDMNSVQVGGHLLIGRGAEFGEVRLAFAKIQGSVAMVGARFTGPLGMNSVQVGGRLWMGGGAEVEEVGLVGAKIQGDVVMEGANVTGMLNMTGLRVENSLLMRHGEEFWAEFGVVMLQGARIGDWLDIVGAKFTGPLDMYSVQVGGRLSIGRYKGAEVEEVILRAAKIQGNVEMVGAKATGPLTLTFAEIGGHVELVGKAAIPSIDLTGARIRGEFRLGSRTPPTTWQDDAKVTLQNAEVGALQDIPEVWPPHLELSGFRYAHLGAHTISRYQEWLARQATYSPQPYEQLAGVLQKMGHKDTAEDILYAGKDRELCASSGFDWVGLFLQKIFIGYGYRLHCALWWVLGFIVLGALVLKLSNEGPRHNMPYGLAYSFDMLLPLVKLREHHYSIELGGWPRYYFYVHKIMGYVLASFLIAGLSGLTK